MASRNTNTTDTEEAHGSGETDQATRLEEALSLVSERARDGTIAALVGGILFANALRAARRDRRRGGLFALGGAVLVALGLRQRGLLPEMSTEDGDGEEGAESAEARANLEQSKVLNQSETNPRGVSGEPDVETETDPDEGDVRFTTEQEVDESEPKPHLDGEEDPRLHDEDDPDVDDDHVEVDLSESAMADEASEAAGPTDEQSYPAIEGTDPEPMSEEAPQRYGEGDAPETDSEDEGEDTRAEGARDDEDAEAEGTWDDEGTESEESRAAGAESEGADGDESR